MARLVGRKKEKGEWLFYLDDGVLKVGHSKLIEVWPDESETDEPDRGLSSKETFAPIPYGVLRKYLKEGSVLLKLAAVSKGK